MRAYLIVKVKDVKLANKQQNGYCEGSYKQIWKEVYRHFRYWSHFSNHYTIHVLFSNLDNNYTIRVSKIGKRIYRQKEKRILIRKFN